MTRAFSGDSEETSGGVGSGVRCLLSKAEHKVMLSLVCVFVMYMLAWLPYATMGIIGQIQKGMMV